MAQGARREVGRERGNRSSRRSTTTSAPTNYYRAFRDIAAWMPKNAIIIGEGAEHDGYRPHPAAERQMPARASTPAPTAPWASAWAMRIAAAVVHPDRPIISSLGRLGDRLLRHGDGDAGRYNLPVKIVVLNNGGIGPGMPEIPENPMMNLKPERADLRRALRQDDGGVRRQGLLRRAIPKDLKAALDEAMKFKGPALVNVQAAPRRRPQAAAVHLADDLKSRQSTYCHGASAHRRCPFSVRSTGRARERQLSPERTEQVMCTQIKCAKTGLDGVPGTRRHEVAICDCWSSRMCRRQ